MGGDERNPERGYDMNFYRDCRDCGWCSKKIYTTLYGQAIEYNYCTLGGESPDLYAYNGYDNVPSDWECSAWIDKKERAEFEALRDEIAEEWASECNNPYWQEEKDWHLK